MENEEQSERILPTFNLFAALYHISHQSPGQTFRHGELERVIAMASELGLVQVDPTHHELGNGRVATEVSISLPWIVETRPATYLIAFPSSTGHSGEFEWDGTEATGSPKWLWDSRLSKTVEATPQLLENGYVAVSYTWGRWKVGTTKVSGTDWQLPVLHDACGDIHSTLKNIMAQIPGCRYFWVDVLCINQDDPSEMVEEISKQAAIFGGAKGCLVYLWSLDSADELSHVMASVGDLLLRSLQFSDRDEGKRSDLVGHTKLPAHIQRRLDGKLRLDPWFSSLWALQEMVLVPSGIWMTKSGTTCLVNSSAVTTHFVAKIVELIRWCFEFRYEIWHSVVSDLGSPVDPHTAGVMLTLLTVEKEEKELEIQRIWKESITDEEKIESEARVRDITMHNIWLDPRFFDVHNVPDSYINRQRTEILLYRELKRWIHWGVGEANLNVTLGATRTQIVVAGTNRHSTRHRAHALLAALKISYDPSLSAIDTLGPGALPIPLLNKLLHLEHSVFFFASHEFRIWLETRSSTSPLYTYTVFFAPSDGRAEASGLERPGALSASLSSTLPSTATFSASTILLIYAPIHLTQLLVGTYMAMVLCTSHRGHRS